LKIEIAQPPMLEEITKVFPNRPAGVIYAFGDTIYNPGNLPLARPLIAHESVHGKRQMDSGGPDLWWRRYLDDKQFRFDEELRAHVAEALTQMPKDRNHRAMLMLMTARRLAAPFYEYGPGITAQYAERRLRQEMRGALRS
jgi:hypothetical protein